LVSAPVTDDLEEAYPEAAPFIWKAVEEHGEEWVIENYFPQIAQLGVVMSIPDVEDLPFFDPDRHEARARRSSESGRRRTGRTCRTSDRGRSRGRRRTAIRTGTRRGTPPTSERRVVDVARGASL
jgi:hypothetical protein